MIQHVGGGRVIDHGPQAPRVRHDYLSGVALGEAIGTTRASMSNLGKTTPDFPGTFNVALRRRAADLTPEELFKRREQNRISRAKYLAKHTGCDCHEFYGGQVRPIGYRERERDRMRLRREMGLKK